MSKSHYEQQKLLIENFRKWESEGEILEEGLGAMVLSIQTIRTIANVMQVMVRSEIGRKAISSIPRHGPEILSALDKYGDKFAQWFQTKSEEIKKDHPFFYRLVYYPYLMIGYVSDFSDMAALELTNFGAKYIKAKQADKAADEKEKAELEQARKERIKALPAAEVVRDSLLKDIERTQDFLDMENPEDVKRIRVSDPSPGYEGGPRKSRAKKFKFEPGKK
tara:strand:- start:1429 stop:2091 length:663 start_codon:yes stop_codon:yes gene_type:complete